MTGRSSWLFAETGSGWARTEQLGRTRMLRMKVELWYRPYLKFMRRWMSR